MVCKVKVCKSQCSAFKDLYTAYVQGEVEKETMEWMKEHEKECSYCSKLGMDREAIVSTAPKEGENKDSFDEAKSVIKRVKVVIGVGMGLIIFVAMWMSIWQGI